MRVRELAGVGERAAADWASWFKHDQGSKNFTRSRQPSKATRRLKEASGLSALRGKARVTQSRQALSTHGCASICILHAQANAQEASVCFAVPQDGNCWLLRSRHTAGSGRGDASAPY